MRVSVLGATMIATACGGGPSLSTAAAPTAASAVGKPALPSPSASAPASAPAVAASAPQPFLPSPASESDAPPKAIDPAAPELARLLAAELKQSSEADLLGRAKGLPAPRDPNDNNVVGPQHKTGPLTSEMLGEGPLSLDDLQDFDAVCAPPNP